MLITSLFIGFLIGALLSGQVSREFGRTNSLVYIVYIAFVISLLSAYT